MNCFWNQDVIAGDKTVGGQFVSAAGSADLNGNASRLRGSVHRKWNRPGKQANIRKKTRSTVVAAETLCGEVGIMGVLKLDQIYCYFVGGAR